MKSATRLKILQRAAGLFFVKGFSTGIDHVTRECRTAKMTIYQHFKNKEGLICSVLHHVQSVLCEHIRSQTADPNFGPATQLEVASHIICYGMNDPDLMAGLGV